MTSVEWPCSSRSMRATATAVMVFPSTTTSPSIVPPRVRTLRASVCTALTWEARSCSRMIGGTLYWMRPSRTSRERW